MLAFISATMAFSRLPGHGASQCQGGDCARYGCCKRGSFEPGDII